MSPFYSIIITIFSLLLFVTCQDTASLSQSNQGELASTSSNTPNGLVESFDGGFKQGYAAGTIQLASGEWLLDNALINTDNQDRFEGLQAVRIKDKGRLSMNFDVSLTQGVVSVKYGVYGTDRGGEWQLWFSTNQGATWTALSESIFTGSTDLTLAEFAFEMNEPVRFEIRKLTEGKRNRLNFDSFEVRTGEVSQNGGVVNRTNPPTPAPADLPTQSKAENQVEAISDQSEPTQPSFPPPPPSRSRPDRSAPKRAIQVSDSPHFAVFGIPSDDDPSDDHIIVKDQYGASYNPQKKSCQLDKLALGQSRLWHGKAA